MGSEIPSLDSLKLDCNGIMSVSKYWHRVTV